MNNLSNTSASPPRTAFAKTSQYITNTVPANSVLPVPCAGNSFYVLVATGPMSIKPIGGNASGVYNQYEVGTGLDLLLENAFNLLEVKNENAFPIVFRLFIGFDSFIDKRLILAGSSVQSIAFPTYPIANAATVVNIVDQSGLVITDINGNQFYALTRESITISNPDTGVTLLVQASGSVVSNGPAIAAIYPLTTWQQAINGNFTLNVGGGPINALVNEVYAALPKT